MDPYDFDFDFGSKNGKAKKLKAKASSSSKTTSHTPAQGMSALEKANFYLGKYTKQKTSNRRAKRSPASSIGDSDGFLSADSDKYLDPDYESPKAGLSRSRAKPQLHLGIKSVDGDEPLSPDPYGRLGALQSESKDSDSEGFLQQDSKGSLTDLHGAPMLHGLDSGDSDAESLSSRRKVPKQPSRASPSSPSSPSSQRRAKLYTASPKTKNSPSLYSPAISSIGSGEGYHAAMRMLEEEEEERRKEALAMLEGVNSKSPVASPAPSESALSYTDALKSMEDEEEERRREAIAMLQGANEERMARSPQDKMNLRVEISNSNYDSVKSSKKQHTRTSFHGEISDEEVYTAETKTGTESLYEEDSFVSREPRSALSKRSEKSRRSLRSVRSTKTNKSSKSQKSHRSQRSTRSTKSNKSATKSVKSQATSLHDEYSMDDFESEAEVGSPGSRISRPSYRKSSARSPPMSPRSPLSPLSPRIQQMRLGHEPSRTSPLAQRNSRIRHSSQHPTHKPKMVDSFTQHVEQADVQIQANLVVSASGLVYELPQVPIGSTLFEPPSVTAPTSYVKQGNNDAKECSSNTCANCGNAKENTPHQPFFPPFSHHMQPPPPPYAYPPYHIPTGFPGYGLDFASYALLNLQRPFHPVYATTYSQAMHSNTSPVTTSHHQQETNRSQEPQFNSSQASKPMEQQTPPPNAMADRMKGITASLLTTNNMFKQNLDMIRNHLADCRYETDRVISEINAGRGGGYYSSFSEVQDYIRKHRPNVRSKEQVLKENQSSSSS